MGHSPSAIKAGPAEAGAAVETQAWPVMYPAADDNRKSTGPTTSPSAATRRIATPMRIRAPGLTLAHLDLQQVS